jgi:hypothetical protein
MGANQKNMAWETVYVFAAQGFEGGPLIWATAKSGPQH